MDDDGFVEVQPANRLEEIQLDSFAESELREQERDRYWEWLSETMKGTSVQGIRELLLKQYAEFQKRCEELTKIDDDMYEDFKSFFSDDQAFIQRLKDPNRTLIKVMRQLSDRVRLTFGDLVIDESSYSDREHTIKIKPSRKAFAERYKAIVEELFPWMDPHISETTVSGIGITNYSFYIASHFVDIAS